MPGYPPKADVRADMPFVALCQYGYHPQPVRSSRVANSPRRCSLAKRSLRVRLFHGRESGCLHDRPPAICVGLDLTSKVGRREAADIQRLIGKTGLHFLGLQSRAQELLSVSTVPLGVRAGTKMPNHSANSSAGYPA